jgi:hypothetical protein
MATTTATATATTFNLTCPGCHEEGSITINLNDLGNVTCQNCNEEYDPSEIAAELTASAQRWAAVARLVETARRMAGEIEG